MTAARRFTIPAAKGLSRAKPAARRTQSASRSGRPVRGKSPAHRNGRTLGNDKIYQTIVEQAHYGLVILEDDIIVYANPRALEFTGSTARTLIGTSILDHVPPSEAPRLREQLLRRKHDPHFRAKFEVALRLDRGEEYFVDCAVSALPSASKPSSLVLFHDVTARRRSELALQEAEEKYRQLVDHSLAGIYITQNHTLMFCNQKFAVLFGWESPEELRCIPINSLVAPESWPQVDLEVRLRESGQKDNSHYEFKARRKDGSVFDVEAFGCRIVYRGAPAIIGTLIDISDRKAVTRDLTESNARLNTLLQAIPDIVYFKDASGRNLIVNKAFEAAAGLPADRILGRTDAEIFPAEFASQRLESDEKTLRSGSMTRSEQCLFLPGDKVMVFETTKIPIMDGDGRPQGLVGVSRNITDRKHAERIKNSILKISEAASTGESLDVLFRSIHGIIGELMPARNFYIALYDEASDLLSFPYFVDECDNAPPPKKPGRGLTEYVLRTGEPLLASPERFALLEKNGHVESIGAPSIDWLGVPLKHGGTTLGVAVVQTYTEGVRYSEDEKDLLMFVSDQMAMAIHRSQAASELQERERFLSSVINSIQDGISILDNDYTILRVNKTMEQWYAHVRPLVGRKCYEAYHLRGAQCEVCPTRQTLAGHRAAFEVVPKVGMGGTVVGWLDLYSFPLIDQKSGQMKGVIEYVRDITERKLAQDRLQSSLREKEVLLREVHHRVKNNLQVIQSLLSLQSRHFKDGPALEMFRESQRRIRSIALVHERLYQSSDLSRIEFVEYVRSLVIHLFHSMLSDADQVSLAMDAESVHFNINTAIPCGLIINELVSNALKHAFPNGRKGDVCIGLHRLDGDHRYRLSIKDNGIGLPPGFELAEVQTLGLQIVQTLISQINGHLKLRSGPGTEFEITFSELDYGDKA